MTIIKDYIKWKLDNPDEDYQYDEIHEFLSDYDRGSLQGLLEFAEEYYKKLNNL